VGLVAFDFLLETPFPIPRDVKVRVEGFVRQGGGPAANAAVALARLGVESRFCGATGDDGVGKDQVLGLELEGVDVSGVRTVPGAPSLVSFILVDSDDGSRTIFSSLENRPRLPADSVRFPSPAPHLLLVDGWEADAQRDAARWARENGVPVLLDAGSCREEILDLLPRCGIVIASGDFADGFSGPGRVEETLESLLRRGPGLAAITRGREGAVGAARDSDRVFEIPAFPVDAVDTTGAGDAFHGGAAWGLLTGRSWRESLRIGSAVAALKCRRPGARAGLPSASLVRRFLEA
jgi:sugar/nucleoside kinase (ribokinase family)